MYKHGLGMALCFGHKDAMNDNTQSRFSLSDAKIGVLGLGYVGLPLALELAKHSDVIGVDVNTKRIESLKSGTDTNKEVADKALSSTACVFTSEMQDIANCNVYIITVPTPIDENNNPDLSALENVSKSLGSIIKKGDIAVYESTVYPGVTEDICGPILEQVSGLTSGKDFFLGYSPERINPGDTKNTLANMVKVVAGQTEEVAEFLCALYGQINNGKIHKATNIKTAEAAKAIENAQRDINVAFINEVTMVLNKLGLSAYDVLDAAQTKWNFLPFTPGLVGGHCIGVDPYYLAKCAQSIGHNPEIILGGRKINDGMGAYFAHEISEAIGGSGRVLVLGFTFKENISDTRNTKVVDMVESLRSNGCEVDVHDPHAVGVDVEAEYGFNILANLPDGGDYSGVVLAVSHTEYLDMAVSEIESLLGGENPFIYDIKSAWRDRDFTGAVRYKCL